MGIIERKEREKQELHDKILASATQLFIENGFEKTSIRNIADDIEYSPATIYLYFKDKNELFYAIQKQAFQRFFDYFRTVGPMVDPVKRLRALGKVYLKFAIENPGYYDLMFIMRAPMNTEKNAENWEEGERSHGVLQNIVNDCQKAGHFKGQDPFVVAHSIWSFVHGLASLYVRDRMRMFPEHSHTELLEQANEVFSDWMEKV
jgi:AcrR family transcriptional regulator